jgi:hypothetical protein
MIGNVAKYPGNFEKESELRKDNTYIISRASKESNGERKKCLS